MHSFELLFSQVFLGLVNGAFYALVSMGLVLVFGLLRITNFAHGSFIMLGALSAWMMSHYAGFSFFTALVVSPLLVGLLGFVLYRFLLEKMSSKDPHSSLLLTFGLSLLIEGLAIAKYGNSGMPFEGPAVFAGSFIQGLIFIPHYRAFVLVVSLLLCGFVYLFIERSLLGSKLRAIQEDPATCSALGIQSKKYLRGVFSFATALAALAGVLVAPLIQVKPSMGSDMIIVIFAIVVIGGMGSTKGSIVAGLSIGLLEGAAKVVLPEAANIVVFLLMTLILWLKPEGLYQPLERSQ